MKFIHLLISVLLVAFLASCGGSSNSPEPINSQSIVAENISLDHQLSSLLKTDSSVTLPGPQSSKISELENLVNKFAESQSDENWNAVSGAWTTVETNEIPRMMNDSLQSGILSKWIDLNIQLLKLTGEVRFGDALENILYKSNSPEFSVDQLKSVIYTHVDDKIYFNILGSSSFSYQHTTGGNVRLIQKTQYPAGNEMVLTSELSDVRYMDVFIRIPSWAKNPSVTHGNVKYVARPGEYCEIFRKWKNGDEIVVKLIN